MILLFQAQPIPSEVVAKLLGNRIAVSPIVTVEPRRRKFHKPITLTIPVPEAATKGMINQYSGDAPTLRLLCSITGSKRQGLFYQVEIIIKIIPNLQFPPVTLNAIAVQFFFSCFFDQSIKKTTSHLPQPHFFIFSCLIIFNFIIWVFIRFPPLVLQIFL